MVTLIHVNEKFINFKGAHQSGAIRYPVPSSHPTDAKCLLRTQKYVSSRDTFRSNKLLILN